MTAERLREMPEVGGSGGGVSAASRQRSLDAVLSYLYSDLGRGQAVRLATGAGLDRARALFALLGNPQDEVPTVHVAGTAGKGSVTAFIAALLRTHGFRVGAHTSPHVYSLLERFTIDGECVPADVLRAQLDLVTPAVDATVRAGLGRPSFFEVTNALAFTVFADRVDYSVVETGLGGLLDSTNTITRRDKLAVITPIGMDHVEVLGPTLAEIATQKAGILPVGGQALAAWSPDTAVNEALVRESGRRGCVLEHVDLEQVCRRATVGPRGTDLHLPDGVPLSLTAVGRHQAGNAYLALRAVQTLAARDGWVVDHGAVREALLDTAPPGRFEQRVLDGRPLVLDGAHNAMKLRALTRTLQQVYPDQEFVWILAFRQDKDLAGALAAIAPAVRLVVATQFPAQARDHPATTSVSCDVVAAAARAATLPVTVEPDPVSAMNMALALSAPREPIVVSGSFHLLAPIHAATSSQ